MEEKRSRNASKDGLVMYTKDQNQLLFDMPKGLEVRGTRKKGILMRL